MIYDLGGEEKAKELIGRLLNNDSKINLALIYLLMHAICRITRKRRVFINESGKESKENSLESFTMSLSI